MQILVISDTHGFYEVMKHVILTHPDADLIIHCGDGERDAARFLSEYPETAPKFRMVRGNCDSDTSIPDRLTIDLPFGHKLTAVHGHMFLAGDFRVNLLRLARCTGSDIILFGHIHARLDQNVERVHFFNPGSLALPHDGKPAAYGLIDVMESGVLYSHGEV